MQQLSLEVILVILANVLVSIKGFNDLVFLNVTSLTLLAFKRESILDI